VIDERDGTGTGSVGLERAGGGGEGRGNDYQTIEQRQTERGNLGSNTARKRRKGCIIPAGSSSDNCCGWWCIGESACWWGATIILEPERAAMTETETEMDERFVTLRIRFRPPSVFLVMLRWSGAGVWVSPSAVSAGRSLRNLLEIALRGPKSLTTVLNDGGCPGFQWGGPLVDGRYGGSRYWRVRRYRASSRWLVADAGH
jgi:hypothetical protein